MNPCWFNPAFVYKYFLTDKQDPLILRLQTHNPTKTKAMQDGCHDKAEGKTYTFNKSLC